MSANLLSEPIVLLALALVGLLVYRLSGFRRRRLRRTRARLRVQAGRETNPVRRHALMQEWRALGGLDEYRRHAGRREIREQGQRARADGKPLAANPYGRGWWGRSRAWRRGWESVERQVQWIEHKRGAELGDARQQGQRARADGQPLAANPYGHALWGRGRAWRQGWLAVNRNVQWIERQRR